MNAAPPNLRQHGVVLIATLFLIIILAALGLFAMRIGDAQQQSINLDLLGARAQAAANAGIEYGANLALNAGKCGATLPSPVTLSQAALAGFIVQVSCSSTLYTVSGNPFPVYALTATAQLGTYGTVGYVARQARRTVTTAP